VQSIPDLDAYDAPQRNASGRSEARSCLRMSRLHARCCRPESGSVEGRQSVSSGLWAGVFKVPRGGLSRPAIGGQSVSLDTINRRPERRSNDGQKILNLA
jgi:hypothetical protein